MASKYMFTERIADVVDYGEHNMYGHTVPDMKNCLNKKRPYIFGEKSNDLFSVDGKRR